MRNANLVKSLTPNTVTGVAKMMVTNSTNSAHIYNFAPLVPLDGRLELPECVNNLSSSNHEVHTAGVVGSWQNLPLFCGDHVHYSTRMWIGKPTVKLTMRNADRSGWLFTRPKQSSSEVRVWSLSDSISHLGINLGETPNRCVKSAPINIIAPYYFKCIEGNMVNNTCAQS